MHLGTARLCLNCEEVHDAPSCPVCASETFTYLRRWVHPESDRTGAAREPSPETADRVQWYRHLIRADAVSPAASRLMRRGAVTLATLGAARWIWRRLRPGT